MYILLIFLSQETPSYSYDVTTSTLIIGECQESICVIDRASFQKSGPYSLYVTINITKGIEEIAAEAFSGCTSLKYLILSHTIKKVGTKFSTSCPQLTKISLASPSEYFECDENGVLYTTNMETIVRAPNRISFYSFPEKTKRIGGYCFEGVSLEILNVPGTIDTLLSNAFVAANFRTITFSEESNLTELLSNSLRTNSEVVNLPKSIESICEKAFVNSYLSVINFSPDTIVTSFGKSCFSGCKNLVDIILPKGITSLPESTFEGCISLISISIPSTVESIDATAFMGCMKLNRIIVNSSNNFYSDFDGVLCNRNQSEVVFIPSSKTSFSIEANMINIGKTVLQQCPNLTMINVYPNHSIFREHRQLLIEESSKSIFAFVGGIESVEIPSDIVELSAYCGSGLTKLKSLRVPSSTKYINEGAFKSSTIETLIIESTNLVVSEAAFDGCSLLSNITILSTGSLSLGRESFQSTKDLKELTAPSSLNLQIGIYTFQESGLKYVYLSDCSSVALQIGSFRLCTSLIHVELPLSLSEITSNCFAFCYSLSKINLKSCDIVSVRQSAFLDCKLFESVSFTRYISILESNSFKGCSSLASVTFEDDCSLSDLTSASIFENCGSLTAIVLPSSVVAIHPSIFTGCFSLVNISIGPNQNRFFSALGLLYSSNGALAICGAGVTNALISKEVTSFGPRCFYGCSLLQSVLFDAGGSKIESIAESTFVGCSKLSSIQIPSSIKKVLDGAFKECTSLATVIFEENSNLSELGSECFKGCSSLKSFHFPPQLLEIGSECFAGSGLNGWLVIPSSVSSFGSSAFLGCGISHVAYCGNNSFIERIFDLHVCIHVYIEYPHFRIFGVLPERSLDRECNLITQNPENTIRGNSTFICCLLYGNEADDEQK